MSKEVKTITIEVPAEDWKYLEWEAEKFKTTPEAIAAKMINLYLRRPEKHMTPKEALESLRKLRKDMPGKDLPKIDRCGKISTRESGTVRTAGDILAERP